MKEKIKIILSSPVPPPYGGIGNWTLLMQEYLKDSEVDILQINTSPKDNVSQGMSFLKRLINGYIKFRENYKDLKKQIKLNKDIACAHLVNTASLSLFRDIKFLKYCKKKRIKTCLQFRVGRIPSILEKRNFEKKLLLKACDIADTILVLDTKSETSLKKFYNSNKIGLIPNPINISKYQENAYNYESDYAIFIGWVLKTKGIEELLKAWEMVSKKYQKLNLKIVGPYASEYFCYLKNKFSFRNVTFYGLKEHTEVIEILSKAKFLILPSYSEGFPNVVLEAMALKIPVAASKVGAIPEMLQNGDNGYLFDEINSNSIIKTVDMIQSDSLELRKKSNISYNYCYNYYDINNVVKKYIEMWRRK